MTRNEIMRKALDIYGIEAQTLMVFEEMSELQKELCKRARGKDNVNLIAEEIADVLITVGQMILYYNITDKVNKNIDEKLKRLEERMNCVHTHN